jgi:hypothetical protein
MSQPFSELVMRESVEAVPFKGDFKKPILRLKPKTNTSATKDIWIYIYFTV